MAIKKIPNTHYSTEDFQKWGKAKYGKDFDLGKFGVDGDYGPATKSLWDKYGKEFIDEQTNAALINPLGTSKLTPNLSNIVLPKASSDPRVALMQEKQDESDVNTLGKDLGDAKMLRSRGIADLIPDAAGGIYGLSQIAKGHKLSKNLHPPKYPNDLLPNQQLSTLLAKVGVNADMADPKIREQALRDITTNREMANEAARIGSAGDVTSYSQNAQNNYLKSNDAVRKLATDETADIDKNRRLLANLIPLKMNEDRALRQDQVDKFNNVDYPEFKGARGYAAGLTNTGTTNLFGAAQNAVGNAPILSGYNNVMAGFQSRYDSMTPQQREIFDRNYPNRAAMLKRNRQIQDQSILSPTPTDNSFVSDPTVQNNLPSLYNLLNGTKPVLPPMVQPQIPYAY